MKKSQLLIALAVFTAVTRATSSFGTIVDVSIAGQVNATRLSNGDVVSDVPAGVTFLGSTVSYLESCRVDFLFDDSTPYNYVASDRSMFDVYNGRVEVSLGGAPSVDISSRVFGGYYYESSTSPGYVVLGTSFAGGWLSATLPSGGLPAGLSLAQVLGAIQPYASAGWPPSWAFDVSGDGVQSVYATVDSVTVTSVAVPEPATLVTGMMLLAPFGLNSLRSLQKRNRK